jgi:hypothetical protein
MSSSDLYPPASYRQSGVGGFLSQLWSGVGQTVGWLDEHGRKAWIAVTVAAFFLAPPVGVALLLFMIGTGRMFSSRHSSCRSMSRWGSDDPSRYERKMMKMRGARMAMRTSGNRVFDDYKAETLRRLEEEQEQFEQFLARLREAKDKAEFDQFMEDRARRAQDRSRDEGQDDAA